jgi:hypothetical protein
MRFEWRWGALGAWGFFALGCLPAIPDYPPPPPCNTNLGLCPMSAVAGGGVGPTGTGGGGVGGSTNVSVGGSGGSSPLVGNVDLITSPAFDNNAMTPFTGMANIVDYPTVGGSFTASYAGGSSGSTFAFTSLPEGASWFIVQDLTNGGSGIFSTLSTTTLPVATTLTLPVIDSGMMQNIASNLPSIAVSGVSTLASHVVLLVSQAGSPYPGVSMTGTTGGATVVYDTGSGVYTDSGTATGIAGTIILFNSGLSGMVTLTLTNSTMMTAQVVVDTAQGAVTLASVAWP